MDTGQLEVLLETLGNMRDEVDGCITEVGAMEDNLGWLKGEITQAEEAAKAMYVRMDGLLDRVDEASKFIEIHTIKLVPDQYPSDHGLKLGCYCDSCKEQRRLLEEIK